MFNLPPHRDAGNPSCQTFSNCAELNLNGFASLNLSNLKELPASADRAIQFLKQYPTISRSLLIDCKHDIDKLSTLVSPILEAPHRSRTPYYIQAVTTGRTAFLTTNLTQRGADAEASFTTKIASSWLIGRNRTSSITISDPAISRCHAVIGHTSNGNFYLMDVGSRNGTSLGGDRLPILERRSLQDGDLIAFSHLQAEFFVVSLGDDGSDWEEPTCIS